MKHTMVAVFDVKLGAWARPIAVPNGATAVRSFADAVNDPASEYAKHPEDYSMWSLGTYDDNSGEFTTSKPEQLCQAVALLKSFGGD